MTIKKFIITWKDHQPFPVEIDDSKTILDLKQLIAKHHGQSYTDFIILNGVEPIDNSKNGNTIVSCGLNRVVRCCDNYNPGIKKSLLNKKNY
jgi:hypothetical protein